MHVKQMINLSFTDTRSSNDTVHTTLPNRRLLISSHALGMSVQSVLAVIYTSETSARWRDGTRRWGRGSERRYIQVNSIQSQCDKLIFQPGHLRRRRGARSCGLNREEGGVCVMMYQR